MAKRKKREPWDTAFVRVRVRYRSDRLYPVKSMAAELDAAERQLGVKLPASYRAFATSFGLGGDLMEMLRLDHLTDTTEARGSVVSRADWNRANYAHVYGDIVCARALELHCRGIVFAWDEQRVIAFDPVAVTDATRNECRIYLIPRDDEPQEIAESFAEFLVWLQADSPMDWSLGDDDDGRWIPDVIKHDTSHPDPIEYWPWSARKKQPVLKRDVKHWMKSSNVRDLALAIRDHGRADAFPALADALQEAGCANADVLDSCRRGDPEIDGVWVLRVLLGEK